MVTALWGSRAWWASQDRIVQFGCCRGLQAAPWRALARSMDHDGYYIGFDVDAFGNPVRVTDSTGATLQTGTYNIRSLRTGSMNVDLGSWTYGYDALGELTSTTDANAKTVTATYDALGRPLTRVMPEGAGSITSTWTWGTSAAAHEVGRLKQQQISGTGSPPIGRPTRSTAWADRARRSTRRAVRTIT